VELLFYCHLKIFGATVQWGRHEQAIDLVLDYQLAVIVISGAIVFFGDLLRKICIIVPHGRNGEVVETFRSFEHQPARVVQAQDSYFKWTFAHPCTQSRPVNNLFWSPAIISCLEL
jgi:hypothetical protein